MDAISVDRIQELKKVFLQSACPFGGSKFSQLVKPLSMEERLLLFGDEEILEKIFELKDYDALAAVFRVVPADVQEKIWSSVPCQKVLLGIENCSDQQLLDLIKEQKFFKVQELSKKEKNGKFYYHSAKIRALEVLLRHVKTPKILDSLAYNPYFQMILLCGRKAASRLFAFVDVEILFNETIRSAAYQMVDNKTKSYWCEQVNNYSSKLLLPFDVKAIYLPTENYTTWFRGDKKRTLGTMLHVKLSNLHNQGKQLALDFPVLQNLNLMELNILKADTTGIVDQQKLNEVLETLIDESDRKSVV